MEKQLNHDGSTRQGFFPFFIFKIELRFIFTLETTHYELFCSFCPLPRRICLRQKAGAKTKTPLHLNGQGFYSISTDTLKTFTVGELKQRRTLLYNTTLSREKKIRDKLYYELGIVEGLIQEIEVNVVENLDLITQKCI